MPSKHLLEKGNIEINVDRVVEQLQRVTELPNDIYDPEFVLACEAAIRIIQNQYDGPKKHSSKKKRLDVFETHSVQPPEVFPDYIKILSYDCYCPNCDTRREIIALGGNSPQCKKCGLEAW